MPMEPNVPHLQGLLERFTEYTAIPHGSGDEARAAHYVLGFARACGATARLDAAGNFLASLPATPGCENAPPVLLQGHLDMVCASRAGVSHDFTRDALRLRIENGRLMATGTTLGADDGVSVAFVLELLRRREEFIHPPLELLLTVEEETGMRGAGEVEASVFRARRLINLDGGPQGCVLTSCAGGLRAIVRRDVELTKAPADAACVKIALHGLHGGHSGEDIDKRYGNANKLLGSLLEALLKVATFRVARLSGGEKENAIPIESECALACARGDAEMLAAAAREKGNEHLSTLGPVDAGAKCTVEVAALPAGEAVFSEAATRAAVALLAGLPDGVDQMGEADGRPLVLCSSNLGVVRVENGVLCLFSLLRCPSRGPLHALADRFEKIAAACGAEYERTGEYPGWPYAPESPLRDLCARVYEERFGAQPELLAIHAGLECGILLAKLPGADIISIGPTMRDFHTPEEWLDLRSFAETFEFLTLLLKRLTEQ